MRWHEAIKSAAAANVAIRLILVVIPCNFILCQSIGFKLFQSLRTVSCCLENDAERARGANVYIFIGKTIPCPGRAVVYGSG